MKTRADTAEIQPAAEKAPVDPPAVEPTAPRDSPAIRRLMEEVRAQPNGFPMGAFDRAHNRHNRS